MKNRFNEKHTLPLTFKFIEPLNKRNTKQNIREQIIYFVKCDKYQTDFFVREKPFKPLTRML